jgi:kynurenine formamidase
MGKKVFVDLTHPFSAEIPRWPYFVKPVIDSMHTMAKGGVLTQRVDCVQHTGTHADAPRHVMEREFDGKRARYTHEMPVDAYTGDAVCLEIKIHRWGLIVPEHLEDACKRANIKPEELKGMVVCLNTGMHRKFDDSKEYYHYSCGTGVEAGKWFVKHKVKCVAMDMQALDHPLHTAMGKNGPPQMNLPGNSGKQPTSSCMARPLMMPNSVISKRLDVREPGNPATSRCWVTALSASRTSAEIWTRCPASGSVSTAFRSAGTWATARWSDAWPRLKNPS